MKLNLHYTKGLHYGDCIPTLEGVRPPPHPPKFAQLYALNHSYFILIIFSINYSHLISIIYEFLYDWKIILIYWAES